MAGTTKTGGGEKLPDPIIAGKTAVELDLRRTGVDPNGTAAFHVLRIGQPAPAPCPVLEAKKCKGGKPPNLRPAKVVLGKPAVYPTVVVSDEQLAKDNGNVPLVFPKASPEGKPWSVQHTVYDETGAVGRSRYDGFVVETPDAKCSKVQGREVGPAKLVFSGACVDTYDDKKLFASKEPVTLNGLTVRPEAGKMVIVAACGGKGRVVRGRRAPGPAALQLRHRPAEVALRPARGAERQRRGRQHHDAAAVVHHAGQVRRQGASRSWPRSGIRASR